MQIGAAQVEAEALIAASAAAPLATLVGDAARRPAADHCQGGLGVGLGLLSEGLFSLVRDENRGAIAFTTVTELAAIIRRVD